MEQEQVFYKIELGGKALANGLGGTTINIVRGKDNPNSSARTLGEELNAHEDLFFNGDRQPIVCAAHTVLNILMGIENHQSLVGWAVGQTQESAEKTALADLALRQHEGSGRGN